MWIVYLAIPLGSGLMCFRFLQVAWWFYWTDRLPHHDETHVEGVETDASAALHPKPVEAGEARGFSPLGIVLILLPILIVAVCIGDKAGVIALPPAPKAVEARAK
jgi:C4-dicarboxylate transporter DctM subunit